MWLRKLGFTLIEILVVISILMLLAGILMPVLVQAKRNASAVSCASNLKQVGAAVSMYLGDSDDIYPNGGEKFYKELEWHVDTEQLKLIDLMSEIEPILKPYLNSAEVYKCPLDTGIEKLELVGLTLEQLPTSYAATGSSYWYNEELWLCSQSGSSLQNSTGSLLDSDRSGKWRNQMPGLLPGNGDPQFNQRHSGYIYNILYCDFHVKPGSARILNEAKGKSCNQQLWVISNYP